MANIRRKCKDRFPPPHGCTIEQEGRNGLHITYEIGNPKHEEWRDKVERVFKAENPQVTITALGRKKPVVPD